MILACLQRAHSSPTSATHERSKSLSYDRHFHSETEENDPSLQRQGQSSFLPPLLLCPLVLNLILFLGDTQIDENLSFSLRPPEPQTVALAGHVRVVPAATAERGIIYIFIRNSVLLARDVHF